jgi:hypothetical protein
MNQLTKSLTSLALSALLIAALAVPAGAAVSPVANPEAAVIARATYARLSALTAASGSTVGYQLSGFRTYAPGDFGSLRWLDLATMPSGRMIDVTREVLQNEYVGAGGVSYRPSWSEGDGAWVQSSEASGMRRLTASAALERLAAEQSPELAAVSAITTFRVTATLGGESRSYQAAMLWVPAESRDQRRFFPLDHISQGVEEAAREELPALRDPDLLSWGIDEDDHNLTAPPQSATCTSFTSTTNQGYHSEGSANHAWGKHEGNASFRIVCACTSTCASTCTATIPSASCKDSGFTDMCHKMASALNANATRNDNGKTTPASCGAGYGCVKKSCLFCVCGLGVSVGVSGATVNFTPSGSPDWSGNLQYSRTCLKCS